MLSKYHCQGVYCYVTSLFSAPAISLGDTSATCSCFGVFMVLSKPRDLLLPGGKGALGIEGLGGGCSTFGNFLQCFSSFLFTISAISKGSDGRGGATSFLHSGLNCSNDCCDNSGGGLGKNWQSTKCSSVGGGGVGGKGVLDLGGGGGGVGVEGILDFDDTDICGSVNVFRASAAGAVISRTDGSIEHSRLYSAKSPILIFLVLESSMFTKFFISSGISSIFTKLMYISLPFDNSSPGGHLRFSFVILLFSF